MEVLDALPDILYSNSTPPRTIHLVKYPHIRVTYDEVTKAVRDIWNASSASWAETIAATGVEFGEKDCLKVNFVLHLGQMRSYPGYSLEKLGNRDGYVRRDLDGKIPQTIATSSETPTELQFASCPPILYPDFDVEDLAMRLKSAMPVIDPSIPAAKKLFTDTRYRTHSSEPQQQPDDSHVNTCSIHLWPSSGNGDWRRKSCFYMFQQGTLMRISILGLKL